MMRSVSSALAGLARFPGRLLLSGALLLWGLCVGSLAQITLDGSLGPRGPLPGPHYRIPAEVGQIRGPNLFHSFGEFNVPTQGSATFVGPTTITNILGRVTGGNVSHIDGLLKSEIPGANLYLLNPNGVMFGPNARLEVSGSFHVSTADYLRLADGARFSARLSDTSTLSVAPPAAFGFLGSTPAAITVQGSTLEVPEGQALSVIGGDAQIVGGRLTAPSGRINLASVASPGEVSLTASGLDVGSFAQLGNFHLSHGGLLDVRGPGGGTVVIRGGQLAMESAAIVAGTSGDIDGGGIDIAVRGVTLTGGAQITSLSEPPGQGAAGAIVIRADRVTVQGENSAIGSGTSGAGASGMVMVEAGQVSVREGGAILSSTEGAGPAGSITIKAGALEMDGGDIQARAERGSTGSAGAITVTAGRVTLTGLAQIDSSTLGAGPGGTVTVRATEILTIAGHDGLVSSGLFSNTSGEGTAGTITVEAGRIILQDEGVLSSTAFGSGPGGRILVNAGTLEMESGALIQAQSAASSTGSAGAVAVTAGRITLTGGTQISSGTHGAGPGGTVTVTATEALIITGNPSGLFSSTKGQGAAGTVTLEASRVVLRQEGRIASTTSSTGPGGNVNIKAGVLVMEGGLIQTASAQGVSTTERGGDAGTITVTARSVTLTAGAQIDSSTRGDGHSGTVAVTAADAVAISGDESGLFTSTTGRGPGGDIILQAHQVQLTERAIISAKSSGDSDAKAGNVTITALDTLQMQRHSAVTAEASQAKGGNIRVTASSIVRLQDSQITATVGGGAGDGGNVTIDPDFIVVQGSQITANAFAGTGGRISLTASKAFLADPSSVVTASSTLGINGEVNLQAPVTNISGILVPLPQAVARATELLSTRCAERLREGTVSTLVVRGRDGMPARPRGVLPMPLSLASPEAAEAVGTAGPLEDTVASRVGVLQVDDGGQAQVRGWQGQGFVPAVLALECVK